jgi:hypothetical protein
VRFTLRNFSTGVLFPLLWASVFVVSGGPADAQSSNTRSFQMALWSDPSLDGNTDIRTFFFGHESQPAHGPTVLIGYNPVYEYSKANVGGVIIDWSRVVAVEVDEPYASIDAELIASSVDKWGLSTHCANGPAQTSGIDTTLSQRAAELKSLAPKARFWVNFTDKEAELVVSDRCWIAVFNKSYIDVISTDWYYQDVDSTFYNSLAASRAKPDQQLGLIPGTFYRDGIDDPVTQASYLQGYFEYANTMNQSCNLPLGTRGFTGSFDRCPVWMVLGWLGPNNQLGNTLYVGLLDSRSAAISTKWRQEMKLLLRPDLAHQRTPGPILSTILPLVLQ